MMRRVLMLLGTFLLLLLAYGVYRAVTDVKPGPQRNRQVASSPAGRLTPSTGSQPSPDEGVWLNIEARDKNGRLEGVYRAASWRRHKDGSITLDKPDITMYQPGGEQVHITAESGELYGPGLVGSGLSIEDVKNQKAKMVQRGRLLGAQEPVRIDIVRDAAHPDQTIAIRTKDLDINNDLLQISTEREVEVRSAEADLFGAGLMLQWDSNPDELRQMRLEHGQKMVIYNVPEALKVTPGAAAGKSGSPVVQTADDGYPLPVAKPSPKAAAGSGEAPPLAKAPATRPTSTSAPSMRTRFQAEFISTDGNLQVDSPDAKLDGADKLTLVFNWDAGSTSQRNGSAGKSQPATAPGTAAAKPASVGKVAKVAPKAAGSQAASAPAKAPMVITWNGPLVVRPVPAEWLKDRYKTIDALNADRGTSYASFEEVPSPAYGEKSQRKDYWLSATGKKMTLGDRDTTAWCKRFVFESVGENSLRQTGTLEGGPGEPVRLDMAGRGSTVCPEMTFNRQSGLADLTGPGSMTMTSSDIDFGSPGAKSRPATAATKIASATASAPTVVQTITWSGTVRVKFTEQTGGDGKVRQAIHDARFRQDVHLRGEGADGKSNFIDCENLDVTIGQSKLSPAFRQLPQLAHAWGNVKARQDNSDINCHDLEVAFDEESVTDAGRTRIRTKPVSLKASGTQDQFVKVTDMTDPADPVVATAFRLTSNPEALSADLVGSGTALARIQQGGNYVTGPTIHVDNALTKSSTYRRTWLNVVGAGKSEFMTDRDFQGGKLPAPRPVVATWSHSMDYEGYPADDTRNTDNLRLYGDVQLTGASETMDCGEMTVFFERPHEETKVLPLDPLGKSAAASKPAKTRRTLQVEGLSKKAISGIVAKKGVELASEKKDDKGALLQAVTVTGESLDYQVKRKPARVDSMGLPLPQPDPDVTIQMLGGGVMCSEDYRPDDAREAAPSGANSMRLVRPSQTVFKWTEHMEWVQATDSDTEAPPAIAGTQAALKRTSTVTLTGDVQMAHRSGDKIVKDALKSVTLPANLPAGRDFRLDCKQMIANFAPPADKAKAASKPAGQAGPMDMSQGLGEIEKFIALRDVVLVDGAMEVNAQMVQYDKARPPVRPSEQTYDLMRISGYIGDEKPATASLHYEDAATKRPVPPIVAPYIEVSLRNGQVVKAQAKNMSTGTK